MTDAERVYVVQEFERPEVRRRFLARVYSLVLTQVLVVAALMTAVRTTPALLYRLYRHAPLLMMSAWLPAFWLQLSPKRSKQAPLNYVLLLAFTALTALGLGAATAMLPADLLLRAGGTTAVAMVGLTVYALRSSRDFTMSGGMLSAGLFALLGIGVLQFFLGGPLLRSAQAYLGVVLFSAFIVRDTQLMVGGGKAVQLRADEHVLGALTLFTDLLNLFLYVLRAMMLERNSNE